MRPTGPQGGDFSGLIKPVSTSLELLKGYYYYTIPDEGILSAYSSL